MPYEYVTNKKETTGGDLLELSREDEDHYILKISRHEHRGMTHRLVRLSKDDLRALYLMMDDVVGTF